MMDITLRNIKTDEKCKNKKSTAEYYILSFLNARIKFNVLTVYFLHHLFKRNKSNIMK